MPYQAPDSAQIRALLDSVRTVALVGASANPERPSYGVMHFLQSRGYRVFPVNPGLAGQELLGEHVYASLEEVPESVDMVDIFRASDAVPGVVDAAIKIHARIVWMQLGVVHEKAAESALDAGLAVVMDRCPQIELSRAP